MKYRALLLVASFLILAGCIYKAPLAEKQNLPVDPAVIGLWEPCPGEEGAGDPSKDLLILKFTDTEYLAFCPTGADGMYFRAYPIKVGEGTYVQTEVVGSPDGQNKDENAKYDVVSYTLANGELDLKTLNKDVVNDNLTDSAELRKVFLANEKNKDLFKHAVKYRKVPPKK